MPDKIKRVLLYGNTDKDTFKSIYPDMVESCRKGLIAFSTIAAIGMLCMVFLSLFNASIENNRPIYLGATLIAAFLGIAASKCTRKNEKLIYIFVYVFLGIVLAFGIVLGTMLNADIVSVSFPIIMFAAPLLFTDVPLRTGLLQIIAIVCYTVIAINTQTSEIFMENMLSIIPYGIVSIILGGYTMTIKIRRHVLEYENRFLIESDQLTGMLNRRCFEQHVQLLRENGCTPGMLICAFDVNGLKNVNDNLGGHHAGDELIRGAGNCIEGVFGVYGKCYRTGGDEFMAILGGGFPESGELKEKLNKRCACFKGAYVSGLSISQGLISCKEGDNIDELIKKADMAMYDDKREYYTRSGADRRRRE